MTETFAVLTGDFVKSQSLETGLFERGMAKLAGAAGAVSGWQGAETRFTRQRGDGWQMVLVKPRLTLRAVLYLRAVLRAEDRALVTRISVAWGPGTLGQGDLNSAGGPAFVASGKGLDEMPKGRATGFAADRPGAGFTAAALVLSEVLSDGWTPAQAEVLTAMLAPEAPAQAEVAKALGVSRQAVGDHLRNAQFDVLEAALDAFEGEDVSSESA